MIADTSAWIELFRGRTVPLLEEALARGLVVVPPIVVAELLAGARPGSDRNSLVELLATLPMHETSMAHWVRVGDLRRQLRSSGVSISTPDAHVAQCALDLGAVLLSEDQIFSHVARFVPLRFAAV